jgi:hypothetical protein
MGTAAVTQLLEALSEEVRYINVFMGEELAVTRITEVMSVLLLYSHYSYTAIYYGLCTIGSVAWFERHIVLMHCTCDVSAVRKVALSTL